MRKYILIILIIFTSFLTVQAQVQYDVEPKVEELMKKYTDIWKSVKKVQGYRIQVVAFSGTNSRTSAQGAEKEFSNLFNNIPCYLSYAEPNFRLRVGDFRNRIEALNALTKIRAQYPGAFIVKDKVFYNNL